VIAVANADAALIRRCQANDAAAFNEIVARYKNRVYAYVSRLAGPGPDAEDLAQEVFVRAYLNIGTFQSRACLNTWLFRIATNLCIDHNRRQGRGRDQTVSLLRQDGVGDEESEREIPDERFDPLRVAMNRELGDELERALEGLPDRLRTVVLLHDIEGMPYEQIARVVECPVGTVKSRLFHARMALREKLKPYLAGVLPGEDEHGQGAGKAGGR